MAFPHLWFLGLTGAYVIDAAAKELAADAQAAIRRAGLSQDWIALVIGARPGKLSEQLSGQQPFTLFWRFTCREIRETDFWTEFLMLRAVRIDRALVSSDLGKLVSKLDAFLVAHPTRPMAKAELHTVTVTLPLGQKERA